MNSSASQPYPSEDTFHIKEKGSSSHYLPHHYQPLEPREDALNLTLLTCETDHHKQAVLAFSQPCPNQVSKGPGLQPTHLLATSRFLPRGSNTIGLLTITMRGGFGLQGTTDRCFSFLPRRRSASV